MRRHLHVPYLQEVLKGWLQEFSCLGVCHHVCYYWVWALLCQQCHSVIPRPSKIPHSTQSIPHCPAEGQTISAQIRESPLSSAIIFS